MNLWKILCALIVVINGVRCAKILAVFPIPARSHFTLGIALAKELVDRGHEVTFINAYPQKTPIKNLKEVSVESLQEEMNRRRKNLYALDYAGAFDMLRFYHDTSNMITNLTLSNENVQRLLKSGETFDVVILQQFLNEAFMAFGHHFKAPTVLLCPMGSSFWAYHLFANPSPPSYVPNLFTKFPESMTFLERLENALVEVSMFVYRELVILPKQNEFLREYFPEAPDVKKIMYNASLVLLNSHVSTTSPRPHFPNLIEVGGFHVAKPKPLSEKLKKFLDDAKEGAVVFAMGSNLKLSDLSKDSIAGILKTFGKLKQRVLWKWEKKDLPELPPNVMVQEWLPQNDILAHPNVRAFISHGGLLSTIETIYHGVPIVGIPVFGDQKTNVATAVSNGYAVSVPLQELTEEKLTWALNEILNNPKYREMAQKRSSIMHDQPLKPMDAAVYWIEYVIRHRGATHLRSAALDLAWYQRSLLDVIVFLIAVALALVGCCRLILRKLLSYSSHSKVEKQKKNK